MLAWCPSTYASLGALGLLSVSMALRMSFYRLAGSPGDGEPNSPLTIFYEYQMLNAEWAPIGGFLALANLLRDKNPEVTQLLTFGFFLTRFFFAFNAVSGRKRSALRHMFNVANMTTCYLITFAMSASLLL